MSSGGFGSWNYDQKQQDGGDLESGGGGGDNGGSETSSFLGASGVAIPEGMSWSNFKSSLESQMPQRVMGMNYQERFKVFCALLILSALFFALAFAVGLPMIYIRPQKFALSFTFGSLMFMGSFAILKGPYAHFMGMLVPERLPFTIVYFGSMLATLFFTFTVGGALGYIVVMACSAAQLLALMWYLVTFLPGGAAGMQMLTSAIYVMMKPVIIACTKCWAMFLTRVVGRVTGSG
mmetsp:Transcript_10415/g.22070  ORF Transcript_10415/g.22070 Transcript_10415/m.22070 type:complete len:235 (+) Transcript_10415:69-773(+)|eukprot:CAMPEP_0178499360 /NCGR_PEP_ID=MMETSP0696-20121128/15783_1 /TAXON_ID=265572 /ORGANISM="Extubocellulus spinifer, Strain CCMP396" /LENGTH=234 /DNA_ID=CAMNT_0020128053 /DNA_START=33 /DNA_END=737 /DNA_ORIENTATION=+